MKIEPVVSYVCEHCGKRFTSKINCIYHEKDCGYRQKKICPLCEGEGHYMLYIGIYSGNPYDRICSECNGTGEIEIS